MRVDKRPPKQITQAAEEKIKTSGTYGSGMDIDNQEWKMTKGGGSVHSMGDENYEPASLVKSEYNLAGRSSAGGIFIFVVQI